MPDAPAVSGIHIDREACIGSGMCIVYAPSTFAHDEHAKAVVRDLPHDQLEKIRIAVEACPMGALTLDEH
jgi:ferredoxin